MTATTGKRDFGVRLKIGAVDMKRVELESWRRATLAMVTLALIVFISQRLVVRTFDIVFEICIFYVPSGALILLYVYFKNKVKKSSTRLPA